MKKGLSMFCTLEIKITYFREEPVCSGIFSGLCRLGVGELDQICTFLSPVCSSQTYAPCRSVRSFCSVHTEPSHTQLWEDGEPEERKESGTRVQLFCLASHGGLAPHQHHVSNHQWKTSIRPENPVCCESRLHMATLPALLLLIFG